MTLLESHNIWVPMSDVIDLMMEVLDSVDADGSPEFTAWERDTIVMFSRRFEEVLADASDVIDTN